MSITNQYAHQALPSDAVPICMGVSIVKLIVGVLLLAYGVIAACAVKDAHAKLNKLRRFVNVAIIVWSTGQILGEILQLTSSVNCGLVAFAVGQTIVGLLDDPLRYVLYVVFGQYFFNVASGDLKSMGTLFSTKINLVLYTFASLAIVAWIIMWNFWMYYGGIYAVQFSFLALYAVYEIQSAIILALEFLMFLTYVGFVMVMLKSLGQSSDGQSWKANAKARLTKQIAFCVAAVLIRSVRYSSSSSF